MSESEIPNSGLFERDAAPRFQRYELFPVQLAEPDDMPVRGHLHGGLHAQSLSAFVFARSCSSHRYIS